MKTRLVLSILLLLLLPTGVMAEPEKAAWVSAPLVDGVPSFAPLERRGLEAPRMATVPPPEWIEGFGDAVMVVVLGQEKGEPGLWMLRTNADGTRSLSNAARILTLGQSAKMLLPLEAGASPDHELELRLEPDHLAYRWSQIEKTLVPGEPMPTFRVADLEGRGLESATLLDRWTMIDWWSTSCIPCVESIPELNGLVAQFQSQPVRFLAVAYDGTETVQDFLGKREFDFEQTVVVDDSTKVFGNTFPRTVIVDPQGIVRYDKVGYGSPKVFEQIADLLREGLSDSATESR